ncbi:MAG TPA: sigma-54 dependent transcriptional regulator [Pyrinomonadaceae bacterium]|nr:sigma-54 dependent transcriptional regulator [Pyrinomonadaceae bacterium]
MSKLIGHAPAFQKAIEHLPAIARGNSTVLISGETGTGKELVARALHYLSPRAAYPFLPINCGSLPDTLLEDELFGHERGAFTDAHARRRGIIAQAERGTIFLDEVDALSAKAQVALLRVLQDKKYRSIGSNHEQQADVRILAATNASLEELVRTGAFRPDLFYRLCIFSLHLPPLRERKEDVLLLARHFLLKHTAGETSRLTLSPSACASLVTYDWPGNVRELESTIIRGLHLCRAEAISAEDLGLQPRAAAPPAAVEAEGLSTAVAEMELRSFKAKKQEVIEVFERAYLTRLMCEHRGNVSQAARTAGKERRDLGKLLKKYRLNPKMFQSSNLAPSN